eukprot:TRINITY_DN5178_c0_g1_i2.p2 TRINITY_DN5178_c0_g1~~TRINITY_DN5178_c0_g1_i2.p2  ORF type:complete len:145 (-),score=8.22 TRINITY_DN5178_c0_g1_i2:708-1142(-)
MARASQYKAREAPRLGTRGTTKFGHKGYRDTARHHHSARETVGETTCITAVARTRGRRAVFLVTPLGAISTLSSPPTTEGSVARPHTVSAIYRNLFLRGKRAPSGATKTRDNSNHVRTNAFEHGHGEREFEPHAERICDGLRRV